MGLILAVAEPFRSQSTIPPRLCRNDTVYTDSMIMERDENNTLSGFLRALFCQLAATLSLVTDALCSRSFMRLGTSAGRVRLKDISLYRTWITMCA